MAQEGPLSDHEVMCLTQAGSCTVLPSAGAPPSPGAGSSLDGVVKYQVFEPGGRRAPEEERIPQWMAHAAQHVGPKLAAFESLTESREVLEIKTNTSTGDGRPGAAYPQHGPAPLYQAALKYAAAGLRSQGFPSSAPPGGNSESLALAELTTGSLGQVLPQVAARIAALALDRAAKAQEPRVADGLRRVFNWELSGPRLAGAGRARFTIYVGPRPDGKRGFLAPEDAGNLAGLAARLATGQSKDSGTVIAATALGTAVAAWKEESAVYLMFHLPL